VAAVAITIKAEITFGCVSFELKDELKDKHLSGKVEFETNTSGEKP